MGSNFKDLTGKKFGRWTVLHREGSTDYGHALWRTVCECGWKGLVASYSLLSGNSKSCGCITAEVSVETLNKNRQYRYTSKRLSGF